MMDINNLRVCVRVAWNNLIGTQTSRIFMRLWIWDGTDKVTMNRPRDSQIVVCSVIWTVSEQHEYLVFGTKVIQRWGKTMQSYQDIWYICIFIEKNIHWKNKPHLFHQHFGSGSDVTWKQHFFHVCILCVQLTDLAWTHMNRVAQRHTCNANIEQDM